MLNFTIILYFSDRCLCTRFKIQSNNKVQTLSHITHLWMCYSIFLFFYLLLLTQNILHDSRINVTYQNQREKKMLIYFITKCKYTRCSLLIHSDTFSTTYFCILAELVRWMPVVLSHTDTHTQTVLWHILYYCTQMHQ